MAPVARASFFTARIAGGPRCWPTRSVPSTMYIIPLAPIRYPTINIVSRNLSP